MRGLHHVTVRKKGCFADPYPVMIRGEFPPRMGTVLADEYQDDAREALRELYEVVERLTWGWATAAERAAIKRAKQVLGIPERCKECGQEIRGAGE